MCGTITGIARRTLKARTTNGARKSVKALNRYGKSFALTYLQRLLLATRKQKGFRRNIGRFTRGFNRMCNKSALATLMTT